MKKRKDFIADIFYSMKISKETFYRHVENILTSKQLEIYNMRFDKDGNIKMSDQEIADKLGISRQAVDGMLNKIYARLIILCKRLKIEVDVNKKIEKPVEVKEPTTSKHATELIKSISDLKRLPREKRLNNMISEKVFSDNGADQRSYYDHLQVDVNRITKKKDNNEELTKLEQQKLFDYNAIIMELRKYQIKKRNCSKRKYDPTNYITELRKKTDEFIKEINKSHRLPESRFNNEFSVGKKFSSGADQRRFYNALRHKAKQAKIQFDKGLEISDLNREKIIALKLIDNVLSFYPKRFFKNKLLLLELISSMGIDIEKNKLILSKYFGEVYAKIRFLIENDLPITTDDGTINPIMYLSNEQLEEIYNITMEQITDKYINGVINSSLGEEVIKKMYKK